MTPAHKQIGRYTHAFLLTGLALLLRWSLNPVLLDSANYLFLYPTLIISTFLFGFGPALAAGIIGVLVTEVWILRPESGSLFTLSFLLRASIVILTTLYLGRVARKLQQSNRKFQEQSRAMAESETRFRLALKNAPVTVAAQDRDLRFLWAFNTRTRNLEEIVGRTDEDLFPEDHARLTALKRLALDSGIEVREQMWLTSNGRRLFLDVHIEPLRNEAGQVTGVGIATVDLTPMRQAVDALELSEHRYRTFFENLREVVVVIAPHRDPDGAVADWLVQDINHAGLRLIRRDRDQVIGQSARAFFGADLMSRFQEVYSRILDTGQPEIHEIKFLRQHFLVSIFSLDEQLIAAVSMDITERRLFEETLRENDRRKDEFLAMLAHELRNPLAPIQTSLALMKQQPWSRDEGARRWVDTIGRQVAHLSHIVDDLLDLSRVSRGLVTLKKEHLTMTEVVEQAVETSRPLLELRRHALDVTMEPGALTILADRVRLVQVLVNLLNNAAKFTPEGGRISLSARRDGGLAVLEVRDTGQGIPAEILPHVFDLFYQADKSLARTTGGLGLGLTLTRRLTEAHGGTIEAFSEGAGCGSRFVVRLPLLKAEASAPVPTQNTPPSESAATGAKLKVLLIDDNQDFVDSLGELVQLWGHAAWTAVDGPQGFHQAMEVRPDVILLDIGLPGLSGYELARQFRNESALANIPLLALSGYNPDPQRIAESGFTAHFTKPVDPLKLETFLSNLRSVS